MQCSGSWWWVRVIALGNCEPAPLTWSLACYRAGLLGMYASVLTAHGLSCSRAGGILPDQGSRSFIDSVYQQEAGKNPKGLHAILWDMSLEHQGNCFVGFWSSHGSQQSVKMGDALYRDPADWWNMGKTIHICKDSMRNKHCFGESPFKQERTEQKNSTEFLTSFRTP